MCSKAAWRGVLYPGFPCGSAGKESICNVGDLGSIPGLGRFLGEGNGYPLQYSGPENSMDCTVHGVAKSWTWLSDFHFQSGYSFWMFTLTYLRLSLRISQECPRTFSLFTLVICPSGKHGLMLKTLLGDCPSWSLSQEPGPGPLRLCYHMVPVFPG